MWGSSRDKKVAHFLGPARGRSVWLCRVDVVLGRRLPGGGVHTISYSRQAGEAALGALAPGDALGYYTQALVLYAQADDPDPILGIDLAIRLGTARRQTGDYAFRDTPLDAARRAADLGDTERLVTAALASDRGFVTNVGVIDADKVEILEIALTRLPRPSRPGARARHPLPGAHLRQHPRPPPSASVLEG